MRYLVFTGLLYVGWRGSGWGERCGAGVLAQSKCCLKQRLCKCYVNSQMVNCSVIFKGPSINIGRSVENEMVFSADKSISRVHARIVIDGANSTVNVTDLASRYGTSVSGTKLQPNEPFPVEHGGIIRFGVGGIRVRLVRKQYAFCVTRLEKPQKDQIKRCAKLLSAKIVTQVEQATHVVATKAAATLKMISALVLPLKLVTVEWTSFAETSKTGVVIPSVDE